MEYGEYVAIRKEFRFTMEIFYLAVNKLKYIGNCLGQRLDGTVIRSYYEPRTCWIFMKFGVPVY